MNNVSTDTPEPVLRETLAGIILACKQFMLKSRIDSFNRLNLRAVGIIEYFKITCLFLLKLCIFLIFNTFPILSLPKA